MTGIFHLSEGKREGRQQLFFLAYLFKNGHIKGFTVRSVMTLGQKYSTMKKATYEIFVSG